MKEGHVLNAPALKYSWRITVEDTAPIRELRNEIVDLLEFIEAEPTPRELAWPDGARWNDAAKIDYAFRTLGVQHARPDQFPGSRPKVVISARILIGREGNPNALPVWAAQFLTDTAPDVPQKLAASGHPERHAFIWATFTTPYEIASILDGDALPTQAPQLPDGVTHLWVGSWYARTRTLYWRPDHGWSEAYRIPPDGSLDLSES
jgi:hypothetical protein